MKMCRMGRRLPYVAVLAAVLLVAAPAAGDPGDDKERGEDERCRHPGGVDPAGLVASA